MSVDVAEPAHAATDADIPAARRDPGTRGHTTVAPAVIEKIAARAAGAVPGVQAGAASTLRSWFNTLMPTSATPHGGDDSRLPDADATAVACGQADVRLTISVQWPLPIASKAAEVRTAVARDVHRLTGVQIQRLDIDVDTLPGRPAPVRVQ